jgi:hypothetical protein
VDRARQAVSFFIQQTEEIDIHTSLLQNLPSNSALDQTLDTYLAADGNNSGNGRDLMGAGGITGRQTSAAGHPSTFAKEKTKKEKQILYEIEEAD